MRTVSNVFLVQTEGTRDSYELRQETWAEKFRGGNKEHNTRQIEDVSLTAWVVAPIGRDGKRTGLPVLREVRDEETITWIGYDGEELIKYGLPVAKLLEIISVEEAKAPMTFVSIMRNGGVRVFVDEIEL